MTKRIDVGFFSISHSSENGDDRDYLEWHQLDHMPEQYQIPGIVLGQRWASTPACRAARFRQHSSWANVNNLVCYFMSEPVDETIDEFMALGAALRTAGRFPFALPPEFVGGMRRTASIASPDALVLADVIPFRPHTGVYLLVETRETPRESSQNDSSDQEHRLQRLTDVPGVAGAWSFTSDPELQRSNSTVGVFDITLCYLDAEPIGVAHDLEHALEDHWTPPGSELIFAGPFEAITLWDWERFGPNQQS